MGFQEKLAAMRAKQEAGDTKKAEEAAEKVKAEAEQAKAEKRGELQAEREAVIKELAQAETEAAAADEAIAEVEAFASEMGENLDPEAAAEIDAIKAEATEATQKFEALKAEAVRIDNELAALEESGVVEVTQEPEEVVEETEQVESGGQDTDALQAVQNSVPDMRLQINDRKKELAATGGPEVKATFESASEAFDAKYQEVGGQIKDTENQLLLKMVETFGVSEQRLQELQGIDNPDQLTKELQSDLPGVEEMALKLAELGPEKGQQLVAEMTPLYQSATELVNQLNEAYVDAVASDGVLKEDIYDSGADERVKQLRDKTLKLQRSNPRPGIVALQKAAEAGFDKKTMVQEEFGNDYDRFAEQGMFALPVLENAAKAGATDFVQGHGADIKKAYEDPKQKRNRRRIEQLAKQVGVSLE